MTVVLELDVTVPVFPARTMVPVFFKVIMDSTASACTFFIFILSAVLYHQANVMQRILVMQKLML